MRDIKFRGYSTSLKRWVYGSLMKVYRMRTNEPYYRILEDFGYFNMSENRIEVETDSVGEYTGLTNKNGMDIYEGDLLHRHMKFYWTVKFKNGKWVADKIKPISGLYLDAYQFIECEVIGNIYENKELLTK